MKNFKDLKLHLTPAGFVGDKIKMDRLLNREIVIHAYRIEQSIVKGKEHEKCLWLQLSIGDTKHVNFTSGKSLIASIAQIPEEDFPFKTTIVKDNDRLEFT